MVRAHVEASSDSSDNEMEGESEDENNEIAENVDEDDDNVTPREAGQINRIFVENFMCHRKFG